MTELQLYKFVNNNGCEWRWNPDGHLVIFVSHYCLNDFCQMLGRDAFDDGGLNCEQYLCADGDVALFEFENVLEDFDIEPENVFPKEEEK